MHHVLTELRQDPEYESFLYAPIGEDRRGVSVTVLSMLARLEMDPWGEASDLADLPQGAAGRRLETLMTRFGDVAMQGPERAKRIAGLLALLPRRTGSTNAPTRASPRTRLLPLQGAAWYWIALAALLVGWIAVLARTQ